MLWAYIFIIAVKGVSALKASFIAVMFYVMQLSCVTSNESSATGTPSSLAVDYAAGVMANSLLNIFFGSYLALICESRS